MIQKNLSMLMMMTMMNFPSCVTSFAVRSFVQHSSVFLVNKDSTRSTITTTHLDMVRNRGLEQRTESATPQEGGMTLYTKAGPLEQPDDDLTVGDCPFTHYVRMVLHEKQLEYEVVPAVQDTKPQWLIEHYDGKMPALRHSRECYTESDVIANYLEFFFQEPSLTSANKQDTVAAKDAVDGLFPAIAKYFKHTPDGDEEDEELKRNLEESLDKLEQHLKEITGDGTTFMEGDQFSLVDCSLAPKLYHLKVGLEAFKQNSVDISTQYPHLQTYMDTVFARPSFVDALYPKETVVWGWSNARS